MMTLYNYWRRWRNACVLLKGIERLGDSASPNGIGAYTCSDILAAFNKAVSEADQPNVNALSWSLHQWVFGFTTACQTLRGVDLVAGLDQHALDDMVFDVCAAHPEEKFGVMIVCRLVERVRAQATHA
jgi:hypothetical protein